MAAPETLSDVHVDGQVVPAGSGHDHPLAAKITNPAAWSDGKVPAKAKPEK